MTHLRETLAACVRALFDPRGAVDEMETEMETANDTKLIDERDVELPEEVREQIGKLKGLYAAFYGNDYTYTTQLLLESIALLRKLGRKAGGQ